VLRLLWLAVFHTPGVWQMPLKVMATAAKALGGVDVFTITLLRKPVLTTVVSHRAVARALNQPETTLSVEAVHSTARRALEPPPPRRTAAETAEDERIEAAVVPTLLRHMRAALTRTWWTCTDGISTRLDRVITTELARVVAAPPPGAAADGAESAGTTVDLFDVLSKVVLYAGASAFLGDEFVATHGDGVWRGLRDWQRSAWTLPWVLFPRTARRLRPALLDAHTRAFGPIFAKVSRVMAGAEAAERGTYLADMMDALDAAGLRSTVRPVHIATQVFGVLTALHVNTYATGSWAVAHAATDPDVAAAVTAEADALAAGRPPPVRSPGHSPTHMPVLEAVWAESMRIYQIAPSIRLSIAPWHVVSSPHGAEAGNDTTGARWTVPGDHRLVALCIQDINQGRDYYGDHSDRLDVRRFVPPAAARSWQAAERDRRLFSFAWGPHACIGRRVAEVLLQRLWLGLYSRYTVELVGGRDGHVPSGGVTLPPADFLQAAATAVPTRPVWVRLIRRGGAPAAVQ